MLQDFNQISCKAKTPVWYNGKLVPWEDATVHVATHIFNYGTGVFEGIRMYDTPKGTAIFRLESHLKRMYNSMCSFGFEKKVTVDMLREACIEVGRASKARSGYLRPQVFFGLSKLSLVATNVIDTAVYFWPLGKYRDVEGLTVVTSAIERISPKIGDIEAKVVGYYTNSHYNHEYAKSQGADEAIMLDIEGTVAEASSSNVFYVKDGELYTPREGFILKGITRHTVLELARDAGIKTHEVVVTTDDLHSADEFFLTGTAAEVDPVLVYDGKKIGTGGTGSVTKTLRDLYGRATRGELAGHENWLTYL
jgi:branched-chain amino acid aminotransferase